MQWRWWWRGGAVALATLWAAGSAPAFAATLTAVHAGPAPEGTSVTLELSAQVRVSVSTVEVGDGSLSRVYVDLPPGTRLAPRLPAAAAPANGPVSGIRVGLGEGGGPRVVLDVSGADRERVERRGGGRTVVVTVWRAAATTPIAPAPSVSTPAAPRAAHPPKIVLDPGHGGHDPGAEGYAVEKDVTLAITTRLAALLHERLGAEVVLTRSDDTTLALADRTARANGEQADLFLSIHANADPHGRLHGIETYVLDNTADHATNRLAAMENGLGADLLDAHAGQRGLRYILSDLVQVGKMDESVALARAVQHGLVHHLRARYSRVTDLGVKRGPFYVLVGAYMPCVLVETAFLTHPVEGRRLARADYQEAVAAGLYAGVRDFLADAARRRTL